METKIILPPFHERDPGEFALQAANDSLLYSHEFFPKTVRQPSTALHRKVWNVLEGPDRYVNIQLFRGAAKTTLLRLFASKRVAYAVSRTILYIGKSEGHGTRSADWLRRQVLFNQKWATFYGLSKGSKFQGVEAEIRHSLLDASVWLVALGIEGSVRGVNLDDYRPDLIILDDVITEDNTATPESRQALRELILGSVKESLAAPGEAPHAKLVMLSTPQHKEDPAMEASRDAEWKTIRVGCWTPETEELPLQDRKSIWPEMFPSEILQKEKRHAIARNQGHIFSREKEVRLVDKSATALRSNWLKKIPQVPARADFHEIVMSVDPVPKPTERQIAKNLHNKDFEVLQIWGRIGGDFYLLDYRRDRGHDPSWTITNFFELLYKWNPRVVGIDATAYQSTLAWILRREMKERAKYAVIREVTDNRSKYAKIVDTFVPPASAGALYIVDWYAEFIEQWDDYPDVSHDDDLDAGQIAINLMADVVAAEKGAKAAHDDENLKPLKYQRRAP